MDEEIIYLDTLKPGDWVQVLRTGVWTHPKYGKFEVTDKMLDDMVVNFRDEIAIDYRHGSGKAGSNPEEGKAAGWGRALEKRGDTLWLKPEWTEAGIGYITRGEYRKTSAEFHPDWLNPETSKKQGATLLAVALTNRPFVSGMAPVVLSGDINLDEVESPVAIFLPGPKDSDPTEHLEEVTQKMEKLKELAVTLELDPQDDWADEEYAKAFETHIEGLKETHDNKNDKIQLEDGKYVTLEDYNALKLEVEEGHKKLNRIEAERDVDELVGKKILPKERDSFITLKLENPAIYKELVESRKDTDLTVLETEIGGAGENENKGDKTDAVKFLEAVKEYQDENKVDYVEAFDVVRKKQPDLARAYAESNR